MTQHSSTGGRWVPCFSCCEGQKSPWNHFKNLNILFGLNSVNSFFITCLKIMPMADEQLIFQKCHKRPNLKKKSNHSSCQAFPKRNGNPPPPQTRTRFLWRQHVRRQSGSFKTSLETPVVLWPPPELQSGLFFTGSLCRASQRKRPTPWYRSVCLASAIKRH